MDGALQLLELVLASHGLACEDDKSLRRRPLCPQEGSRQQRHTSFALQLVRAGLPTELLYHFQLGVEDHGRRSESVQLVGCAAGAV